MPLTVVNKNALDVSQIFQAFMAFCGDTDKTALALNLEPEVVRELARTENWAAKIAELHKLKEGEPRDLQVQINRAVNYVQAHRMRAIIDKVISHLQDKDGEALVELLTKTSRLGSEFSARPLADLVKAAEACQLMTQRALGDTAAERPEVEAGKGSSVALQVMAAMNAADQMGLDSVAVVRKELKG